MRLDSTGTAYCWGSNSTGQLGDGSAGGFSAVPVAVAAGGALAGKRLTTITAGDGYTCALDSVGAVYCWGINDLGQLGDGTSSSSSVPLAVDTSGLPGGGDFTQLTASDFHTCALAATGAAYCWGDNRFGELGDDSTAGSARPVVVDTAGALAGKTITQIAAAGEFHTWALDSAGAAFCWGSNGAGDLGDERGTNSSVPAAVNTSGVLDGTALSSISAGYEHTCAVSVAGAAYCWGSNVSGQFGDDGGDSPAPLLVGLDAPVGVACITADATTCTLTGLADGATYSVTVVAHTTVGDSGPSAPWPVTVTHGPAGPIVSGYQTSKCVDDNENSSANDTKVVIFDCTAGAGQEWTIEGDGTIQINGKCLDIYREGNANHTQVELWTCTGKVNQQWQMLNGTFVNPGSRKCLDDPGFNTTDGTQLDIYTCDGGANQQWALPSASVTGLGMVESNHRKIAKIFRQKALREPDVRAVRTLSRGIAGATSS